jgi:hypothetical protein
MNLSRFRPALIGAALLAMLASAPALAAKPGALRAFSAEYSASYMGLQGAGQMRIEPAGGDRWKYSLTVRSNVAQLSQSTTFDENGGKWRPLSGTDSSLLLIKKNHKTASYDWDKSEARWSGDVKPERAGPVKLEPGDLDAMLVNLAVARDAAAGKTMQYRMVDDGRVKQLTYQVVGKEPLTIGGQTKQAIKVSQTDGDKQYFAWIVEGLPVPARILQRKDGEDTIDLQIKSLN